MRCNFTDEVLRMYDSASTPSLRPAAPVNGATPSRPSVVHSLPFAANVESAMNYKKWLGYNLRQNVAGTVWMKLRERLIELNIEHQDELMRMSLAEDPSRSKAPSMRKRLSWNGALRVPKGMDSWWPLEYIAWKEPSEGSRIEEAELYYDPGNKVYTAVLKELWPLTEWDGMSQVVIGDHAEAFLGLYWMHRFKGKAKELPGIVHWFIEQLEYYVALVFVLEDAKLLNRMMSAASATTTTMGATF